MKSVLNIHWNDWCWSWNSSTLATWCKELTHLKRPWCWERLKAGGERDDRGWDGWMASPTWWTWVLVDSGSWWWTGRPGMLWFMGSQRVGHDWETELNWTLIEKPHIGTSMDSHSWVEPFIWLIKPPDKWTKPTGTFLASPAPAKYCQGILHDATWSTVADCGLNSSCTKSWDIIRWLMIKAC